MGNIGMPIALDGASAQLCPGIDAGVRQLVDQDQVIGPHQRGNNAGIGEITGAEHTGRLSRLQPRQSRFQFRV